MPFQCKTACCQSCYHTAIYNTQAERSDLNQPAVLQPSLLPRTYKTSCSGQQRSLHVGMFLWGHPRQMQIGCGKEEHANMQRAALSRAESLGAKLQHKVCQDVDVNAHLP